MRIKNIFQSLIANFSREGLTLEDELLRSTPIRDISIAFSLILVIITIEFTFRGVLTLLTKPTFFNPYFMNPLMSGVGYLILCLPIAFYLRHDLWKKVGYSGFSLFDINQRKIIIISAFIALIGGVFIASRIDGLLFASFDLNSWFMSSLESIGISYSEFDIIFPELDIIAIPVILIVVNGIWVPIAEEFLWRGIV